MARFQISSAAFWHKVRLSMFSGPCKATDRLSFFFLRKWTRFSIDLTFKLNIISYTDLIYQYSSYLKFSTGTQFNPGPFITNSSLREDPIPLLLWCQLYKKLPLHPTDLQYSNHIQSWRLTRTKQVCLVFELATEFAETRYSVFETAMLTGCAERWSRSTTGCDINERDNVAQTKQ